MHHKKSNHNMNTCNTNICMESSNFCRLGVELKQYIDSLTESWNKSSAAQDSYESQKQYAFGEGAIDISLLLPKARDIFDQAFQVLINKQNIELKLEEIFTSASNFIQHLQAYLDFYQRLHIFSKRADKFPSILNEIGAEAEKVLLYLEQIKTLVFAKLQTQFDFKRFQQTVYQVIRDIGATAPNDFNDTIWNNVSYETKFDLQLENFRKLEWLVYQRFTLIIESHPPPVISTMKTYPISLRYFNFKNASNGDFQIKLYLVTEDTVRTIRSSNAIPDSINLLTRNQTVRHAWEGVVHGTIFFKDTQVSGENRGTERQQRKRQRTPSTQDIIQNMQGFPVEILEGNLQDKFISLNRNFGLKEIKRRSGGSQNASKVANDKAAILCVVEFSSGQFGQQSNKAWAISSPVIVTSHISQNVQAWGGLVWDEVVPTEGRLGFEVDSKATWAQILKMLQGSFECLVGDKLAKKSHIEYLRRMAEQDIFGGCITVTETTEISKSAMLGGSTRQKVKDSLPFWQSFFETISVIRDGFLFNDIWKNGHIEGFVDYEQARQQLQDGLINQTAQSGAFIVRFSACVPGSLTLVFIGIDNKIYKMEPMKLYKKKSIEECTAVLLRVLDVKERVHGQDVFTHVYPSNTPKQIAFQKFYDWAKDNTSPSFETKGYVVLENMVPLPSTSSRT